MHFSLGIYSFSVTLGVEHGIPWNYNSGNGANPFDLVSNPPEYGNLFIYFFSLGFLPISLSLLFFFFHPASRSPFSFLSFSFALSLVCHTSLSPRCPPLSAEIAVLAGLQDKEVTDSAWGCNLPSDWSFLGFVFIVETWSLPQRVKRGVNISCLPDECFPHVVWRTLPVFQNRWGWEEVFGRE